MNAKYLKKRVVDWTFHKSKIYHSIHVRGPYLHICLSKKKTYLSRGPASYTVGLRHRKTWNKTEKHDQHGFYVLTALVDKQKPFRGIISHDGGSKRSRLSVPILFYIIMLSASNQIYLANWRRSDTYIFKLHASRAPLIHGFRPSARLINFRDSC